jgi:hypothetical protein
VVMRKMVIMKDMKCREMIMRRIVLVRFILEAVRVTTMICLTSMKWLPSR